MPDSFKKPQGPRRSSDNPKPVTQTYSSEAVKPWQLENEPKTKKPIKLLNEFYKPEAAGPDVKKTVPRPVINRAPAGRPRTGKRLDSVNIKYKDVLIFRNGWFVLLEEKGGVCVLTREDAKEIERDYARYCEHMSLQYEGRESNIPQMEKAWKEGRYDYKADALSDPSEDIVIGDVLRIPGSIDGHKINKIYRKTFRSLGIKELILPDSVKVIEGQAFSDCYYLDKITMGPDVSIASDAFKDCPGMKFENGLCIFGNTLYKGNDEISEELIIPYNITRISGEAFKGNRVLKNVVLPPNLERLGEDSFSKCPNLQMVTFTGSGHDIDFGWGYIFREDPNLTSVKLPEGITKIGSWMFQKSESLSLVNIPSTVRSVNITAFEGTKLSRNFIPPLDNYLYLDNWLIAARKEQITVPDIKEGTFGIAEAVFAFSGDGHMDSLKLPDSVKIVCARAFKNSKVKKADLGAIEYLGEEALYGSDLTEVHIPESCKYVGRKSLSGRNLTDIYFHGRDTRIDEPKPGKSVDGRIVRIHGYKGSTAEQYVIQSGEKLGLEFVEI
ncbi:MAG: leucine-rich repeat protein [Lachnospiraceae bacterium]|nr:leucine-rich repeat protein [Lachnospiraceae bacterium]